MEAREALERVQWAPRRSSGRNSRLRQTTPQPGRRESTSASRSTSANGPSRPSPLIDGFGEIIGAERATRSEEITTAVEEAKRAVDAKLEALEQRGVQHIKPRLVQHLKECSGRTHAGLETKFETKLATFTSLNASSKRNGAQPTRSLRRTARALFWTFGAGHRRKPTCIRRKA